MDENQKVEYIEQAILDALFDLDHTELTPAHVVAALVSISVKMTYEALGNKSELRGTLASLVDDFATQSEFGHPMQSQ